MSNSKIYKTSIGGQALIEGIMMVGPEKTAIVVRAPEEEGGMAVKVEENKLLKDRYPILGLPLLRGAVGFATTTVKGVRALMFSADYYPDDGEAAEVEEKPSKFEAWLEKTLGSEKAMNVIIYIAAIVGMAFSIGLFFLLPSFIGELVFGGIPAFWVRNLLEGVLRIGIFLVYLILCSRMKDMKRVFSYHGAEHKTIACYESGLPLTVENVRGCSRFHPRCGTSFLFVVMVVSIIVFSILFTFVKPANMFVRVGLRLLMIPLVVGITYEINRFVGRNDNICTRFVSKPGMWLQNFTTNEPDDSMIEVGIKAFFLVVPEEKGSDAW